MNGDTLIANIPREEDCSGTDSGKHHLEYEGDEQLHCYTCGTLFKFKRNDWGYFRIVKAHSDE